MGAKGEKSHDVASGVAKRSLVRLLIPFSFAAHFEAWREMDEARRDKPRRQALAERLTHGLVGSKRRAQKLCDERHFPLYHALTERFLDADRERPIWRPIATSELDNASGALLPQLVDNLLRDRSRGEAEVTIFELSADARADILGERLFMTRANTYDKARKAAAAPAGGASGRERHASKKTAALGPNDGFFCTLSDVRLTLCSVGVAVLQVDLHLAERGDAETGTEVTDDFRDQLLEFVAASQLVTGELRRGREPVFMDCAPVAAGVEDAVARQLCRPDRKGLETRLLAAVREEAGLSPDDGAARGHLMRHTRPAIERLVGALIGDTTESASERTAPVDPGVVADLRILLQGGTPRDEGRVLVAAATTWMERNLRDENDEPIPEDLAAPLMAAVKRLVDVLKPSRGLSEPAPLKEPPEDAPASGEKKNDGAGTGAPRAWRWEDLLAMVFGRMGITPGEVPLERFLLNGDRALIFTHVLLHEGGPEEADAQRGWAARLSRRHTATYPAVPGDHVDDGPCIWRPWDTRLYAISLEGMAVVVAPGDNKEFAEQLHVRRHHYVLYLLAVLYRCALLDIGFQAIGLRKSDARAELVRAERLARRVQHLSHRIYHGHVSPMTHLQTFFDLLLDRLNVDRLWEDVERDVPQYMAWRQAAEERRRHLRRRRIDRLVSGGGALVVTKELIELFTFFGFDPKALTTAAPVWGWVLVGTGVVGIFATAAFGIGKLLNRDGGDGPLD